MTTGRPDLDSSLAGQYHVERELGRGGMATVYLARDVKHQRLVALKVLDPELGAVLGAERFLSEIRVTANLQHPNLLPLFDSGEAGGMLYYVMPYVEGETLRHRLDREKQLPISEAVGITVAVANALAYAHERGVIHRDLKPENILFQAGQPVVADFGIALAVSNAGGTRVTQTGLSLGTPQYMSPEQATGDRAIDARTDIYSLAAVAYEMLTGEPPHTGTTAQAIIARLMTERPRPVRASRETVPEHVESAIDVALSKLPADRFTNAHEFAQALQGHGTLQRSAQQRTGLASVSGTNASRRATLLRRGIPWAVTAIAVTAAATAWRRPGRHARASTFVVVLPDSAKLIEAVGGIRIALSRDGSQLAYLGSRSSRSVIYIRALDDTIPRLVRGTEGAGTPAFSPDGAWLVFSQNGSLKKVPSAGGSAAAVVSDSVGGVVDWSDRNEILFARSGAIWRMSAEGGAASIVARPDSSHGYTFFTAPHALPGGRAAFITMYSGQVSANAGNLGIVTIPDGKVTALGEVGLSAHYARSSSGDEYILFGRNGALFVAPFSLRREGITGTAVQLFDGVSVRVRAGPEFDVADDGTLAYVAGSVGLPSQLVAVDHRGNERPVGIPPNLFSWPRVSPDGKRIAVEIGTGTGRFDVWLFEIASRALSRLTNNFSGVRPSGWTTDGSRVVYLAVDGNSADQPHRRVALIPWDLSGPPAHLTTDSAANPEDASLGPPGSVLAVRYSGYTLPGDIAVAPVESPRAMRSFVATPADEETPRVSPDGKWLAYASDETGLYEIYARPANGSGGRLQISAGGGAEPVWARDGRSLYYRGPEKMMLAALTTTPTLTVTQRDTLFTDVYRKETKAVQYDVFPNGDLLMEKVETRAGGRPTVVINWAELLRRQTSRAR